MSSLPSITLSPATYVDIPSLARIAAEAFRNDIHTQLKSLFRGEDSHENGFRDFLPSLLENPRCDIIVAWEGEDIVGWVVWARRGYEAQAPPPADGDNPSDSKPISRTIAGLESLTNASMAEWTARFMPPGTKCRYIVSINVVPSHQSRGIGSALIRWGTAKADDDGVFCWVQSSMDGWPAFEKQGFVEVGRLELALDEFAEGKRREEGREWGTYIWRYMRREPKDKPPMCYMCSSSSA